MAVGNSEIGEKAEVDEAGQQTFSVPPAAKSDASQTAGNKSVSKPFCRAGRCLHME